MEKNEIFVTYGSDGHTLTKELLERVHIEELLPQKDAHIVLKPNLVVARTPEGGATTHPSIIIATIEFLQAKGYHKIQIVESAWVGDSTKRGFEVNGYYEISKKYGVPLFDVKDDVYEKKTLNGITMELSSVILKADFLISLPVLKGHCQTLMTCSLKNMKGCLSDKSKRLFHSLGLHKPIATLNAIRCADLTIVDSLNGDLDFEEGGNPVQTDRMFVARDPVLCDTFGATLLGFSKEDVEYIPLAESYGVGSTDLKSAVITPLREPTVGVMAHPTGAVAHLAAYVQPDKACSACYGNLIHALKRIDEMGQLSSIEKGICIGQGYRGKESLDKQGIGSCTCGFMHSQRGCPPSAQEMEDFLLHRR